MDANDRWPRDIYPKGSLCWDNPASMDIPREEDEEEEEDEDESE